VASVSVPVYSACSLPQAVLCGVCETPPELWRRIAGLCAHVPACAGSCVPACAVVAAQTLAHIGVKKKKNELSPPCYARSTLHVRPSRAPTIPKGNTPTPHAGCAARALLSTPSDGPGAVRVAAPARHAAGKDTPAPLAANTPAARARVRVQQ